MIPFLINNGHPIPRIGLDRDPRFDAELRIKFGHVFCRALYNGGKAVELESALRNTLGPSIVIQESVVLPAHTVGCDVSSSFIKFPPRNQAIILRSCGGG